MVLFALPNLFGKAPSIQISREDGGELADAARMQLEATLTSSEIVYDDLFVEDGRIMVRFADVQEQLRSSEILRENLGNNYVVALTLAPRTPSWIRIVRR